MTMKNAKHTLPVDRNAYPFESHALELSMGRMHYVDEGTGEPLVFVHGTPTWSFEWRHLIKNFSPSHRCIAPDLLGFGLSERPDGFSYTPEAHAKAVDEFITKLNPEPFTLVVHDFGGPIALPLALRHPKKIKRLVLINTWMWSFKGDPQMERAARIAGSGFGRFLYKYMNLSLRVIMPQAYGDKKKLTPHVHQQYLARFPDAKSRGQVLWALAKSLLASSDHYANLWQNREKLNRFPALILWGMQDTTFQPPVLAKLQQALPSAKTIKFENAGHWPHEEEPERVTEALHAFLSAGHQHLTGVDA